MATESTEVERERLRKDYSGGQDSSVKGGIIDRHSFPQNGQTFRYRSPRMRVDAHSDEDNLDAQQEEENFNIDITYSSY